MLIYKFSDLTLTTDDGHTFAAHKAILAQRSEYFKALLRFPHHENSVRISGIKKEILQQILEYIYTESIQLTIETISEILLAANYLLIEKLVTMGKEFVIKHLTIENVAQFFMLSTEIESLGIFDHCYRFLTVSFKHAFEATADDFRGIRFENLRHLLTDKNLNIDNKRTIWKCIINWIGDDSARIALIPQLLMSIKWKEQDENLAAEIFHHLVVDDSVHCSKLRAMKETEPESSYYSAILKYVHVENALAPELIPVPPIPDSPKYLNVIVHRTESPFGIESEVFITYDDKFDFRHKILDIDYLITVCIGIHNSIIMFETTEKFQDVMCYDIVRKSWSNISGMMMRRDYFVFNVDGLVYVVGGWTDEHSVSDSIEIFDPSRQQWYSVTADIYMAIKSAATVGSKIFVLGHFTLTGDTDMQAYDTVERSWTRLEYPRDIHEDSNLTAYRNSLIFIGHYRCDIKAFKVHQYYPQTDIWTDLPYIKSLFCQPKPIVIQDRLIVYENSNRTCSEKIFPVYLDIVEHKWKDVNKMCFLKDLPDYRFTTINDPASVKELIEFNRNVKWDRSWYPNDMFQLS